MTDAFLQELVEINGPILTCLPVQEDDVIRVELIRTQRDTGMALLFKETGQEVYLHRGTLLRWFYAALDGNTDKLERPTDAR